MTRSYPDGDRRFSEKRVLVTGAGSGIGAATARAFAAEGARVACADLDLDAAAAVVAAITAGGGTALACAVDVAEEGSNLALVDSVLAAFGGLDIAYLNAGILARGSILDTDADTWDRVMRVNLRGVFMGLRAVVPPMRAAGGGAIVVPASVGGLTGDVNLSAYVAAKHGVVGLVKCAAAEFAADNIRVNAVAPGAVATPMAGSGEVDLGPGSAIANLHPLGRVAQPEDIANLVLFLCSEQASFITGSIYPIDGGMTAVNSPRYRG